MRGEWCDEELWRIKRQTEDQPWETGRENSPSDGESEAEALPRDKTWLTVALTLTLDSYSAFCDVVERLKTESLAIDTVKD